MCDRGARLKVQRGLVGGVSVGEGMRGAQIDFDGGDLEVVMGQLGLESSGEGSVRKEPSMSPLAGGVPLLLLCCVRRRELALLRGE